MAGCFLQSFYQQFIYWYYFLLIFLILSHNPKFHRSWGCTVPVSCRGPRSTWCLSPRIAQCRPHGGSQLNVMMSGPWAGAQGREEETPVSSCEGLKVFWQPRVFTAAYVFVRLVSFLCFEWLTRLRICTLLSKMEVRWSVFLLCLRTALDGMGRCWGTRNISAGLQQSCCAACLLEKDLFPPDAPDSHHQALLFGIPHSLSLTSSHWWETEYEAEVGGSWRLCTSVFPIHFNFWQQRRFCFAWRAH